MPHLNKFSQSIPEISYSQDRGRWITLKHDAYDHGYRQRGGTKIIMHVYFKFSRHNNVMTPSGFVCSYSSRYITADSVAVRNCWASNHTKFMWKHKIVQHHKWTALERVSEEEKTKYVTRAGD